MNIERTKIKSVECLGEVDDYVYDISVEDQDPLFFGNDILVHNTDSVMFSAYPVLKDDIESGSMPWDKDIAIQLYNKIGDEVNATFSDMMLEFFHTPKTRGQVIKAGREIVATKGLFITKKRYALLYYDKDNKRYDVDGKNGKIKAMGLDLKRSDTPDYMQKFLEEVLITILNGGTKDTVMTMISDFRTKFRALPAWKKGSPKRANNITTYQEKEAKAGKATMPGHVRASINWNQLKKMNNDNHSMGIVDGMKVVVCKLRNNPLGYTSIAYPTDQLRLPEWFQELPFDTAEMEEVIVDGKLENLISVLNWRTDETGKGNQFSNLFSFE